jgi:hypothetical protein
MIQQSAAAAPALTPGYILLETAASRRYLEQRRALLTIATCALESIRQLDASEAERLDELRALTEPREAD